MNILLCCNAGMSTSILVKNMIKEAEKRGLDATVTAFGITELKSKLNDSYDVVLIGPQISYRLDEVKSLCEPYGIPAAAIDMKMYGMMRGDLVLDKALEVAGQK